MNATPIQNATGLWNSAARSGNTICRNTLARSTTKPNAINARLVRVHASRVRSAAKNTRGSFRSDMGQLPDSPEHATRIATACLRTGWTGAESPGRLVIIDNLYYRTTL